MACNVVVNSMFMGRSRSLTVDIASLIQDLWLHQMCGFTPPCQCHGTLRSPPSLKHQDCPQHVHDSPSHAHAAPTPVEQHRHQRCPALSGWALKANLRPSRATRRLAMPRYTVCFSIPTTARGLLADDASQNPPRKGTQCQRVSYATEPPLALSSAMLPTEAISYQVVRYGERRTTRRS